MKTIIYRLLVISITLISFVACEFDNYDEPQITFSGRLLDGNETLNTKRGIVFKLYQYKEDGYVSAGASSLNVYMDQEGNFSSLLFPGRYKMVVNTNNGELESPDIYSAFAWGDGFKPVNESTGVLDTIYFTLDKKKTMDFQVTPYYKFNNLEAFYEDDNVVVRFTITKLVNGDDSKQKIRKVSSFLSPTVHVNRDTKLFTSLSTRDILNFKLKDLQTGETSEVIEMKCSLKNYYSNQYYVNNYRNYVYLRLGTSTEGFVDVYNYSTIIKITDIPEDVIGKFK